MKIKSKRGFYKVPKSYKLKLKKKALQKKDDRIKAHKKILNARLDRKEKEITNVKD